MGNIIYKDKTGQQWFLGIYSNNFEDRERETFSWDSHVEFAKWLDDTGVHLPITIAHQPKYSSLLHAAQLVALSRGAITAEEFSDNYMKLYKPFAFAQTEAVIPLHGFVLVAAKILTGKEDVVELLNNVGWGMSHGFLAIDRDDDTIHQYRSFELTVLPPTMAANFITASSIREVTEQMDQTKGLSEKDRETLKNLLNGDPEELEQALMAEQEILQKLLSSKQVDEQKEVDEYEQIREKIFADLNVEQLQKSFTKLVEMIETTNARLDALEPRVKETERSEDERIAEKFNSPMWAFVKELEDEQPPNAEELKEKALGDKPLDGVNVSEKSATDPLYQGLWSMFQ